MSRKQKPIPMTVLVRPEIEQILRARAANNHRPISGEINFLIETALGCESEDVRKTMHLFWKLSGETTPTAEASPSRE
jgi:hypothetical protein